MHLVVDLFEQFKIFARFSSKFKYGAELRANRTDGLPQSHQTKGPDCLAFQTLRRGCSGVKTGKRTVRPINMYFFRTAKKGVIPSSYVVLSFPCYIFQTVTYVMRQYQNNKQQKHMILQHTMNMRTAYCKNDLTAQRKGHRV